MNPKLYKKSFCIKNSKILGGSTTFRECSKATNTRPSCPDTEVTTWDDKGNSETCVTYDCPEN